MSADSFLAGVFPAIAVQDDATNGSYVPTGEQVRCDCFVCTFNWYI